MSSINPSMPDGPAAVWVVYGRNLSLKTAMFDFLRHIGLAPTEFDAAVNAVAQGSPYVGDVVVDAITKAPLILVILSPDEEVRLREQFTEAPEEGHVGMQPRPNVLFEAGMAFALKSETTILLQFGKVRPFSDVAGRHVLHFDGSPSTRARLADRLQALGAPVYRRPGWETTGSFPVVENEPAESAPTATTATDAAAASDVHPPQLPPWAGLTLSANADGAWLIVLLAGDGSAPPPLTRMARTFHGEVAHQLGLPPAKLAGTSHGDGITLRVENSALPRADLYWSSRNGTLACQWYLGAATIHLGTVIATIQRTLRTLETSLYVRHYVPEDRRWLWVALSNWSASSIVTDGLFAADPAFLNNFKGYSMRRDYAWTERAGVPLAFAGDVLREAGFLDFEGPLAAINPSLTEAWYPPDPLR